MSYLYEGLWAIDPNAPSNVAINGTLTICDPDDPTHEPLPLTDPDGNPIGNPVTSNEKGFVPAFRADLDRVAWFTDGLSGHVTSYDGIRESLSASIEAAQISSESAQSAQSEAAIARLAAERAAMLVEAPADSTVANLLSGPTETRNVLSGAITVASERAFTVTKIKATPTIPEHTITRYFGGAKSGVSVKRLVGGGAPTATPVRETLSSFHRRSGAAIVANATGWWTDGSVMGLSIQDGVLLKGWDTGTSDLGKEALVIMRDGSMKIYNSTTPEQQVVDDGGWYSFGWGHAFYKDGMITDFKKYWRYSDSSGQISARQMLGDTLDGDIVLVTFPGVTNSWGATAQNVLDAVAGMNIRTLYNLDCGGSTQTLVDGDYAVSSSDGAERPVPDALAIYSINTTPRKKAVEWVDIPLTAAYERQATFTPQMAIRDGVAYFRGAVKRADGANFTAGATQYLTASIAALTGIEPMDGTRTTWGQTNSGPIRIWVQGTTIQVYIPTGAAVSYIGLSALSGLLLGK